MPDPANTPCNLQPTPLDPQCEFKGIPGTVTLTIEDVVGTVMFTSAAYDGVPILPMPSKTITFKIVSGRKNLDVVYAFSDTVGGAGLLREVCVGNTVLIPVHASDPAVQYRICV